MPQHRLPETGLVRLFAFLVAIAAATALHAGSLTPPGSPASTMKPLDQVEPRTPIASLPFDIAAPGSYYLTGNLQGGAISVSTNNVTIDLCGFTLSGIGVANGIVISGGTHSVTIKNGCITSFTSSGVNGSGSTTGTLLQNLVVTNCGNTGVSVGGGGTFENCVFESNRYHGLYVGASSVVTGCVANNNGDGSSGNGIEVGQGGRIVDCVASANDGTGIVAGINSTVQGCTSRGNGSNGFSIQAGCILSQCTTRENVFNGIGASQGCVISDCSVSSNTSVGIYSGDRNLIERCTVTESAISNAAIVAGQHTCVRQCEVSNNWGTGISVNSNCLIVGNNVSGNGRLGAGSGINVGNSGSRIEDNNVCANPSGISCSGTSNVFLRNTMQGNTTNYSQGPGNVWGAIVTTEAQMNGATNSNVNIALP